MESVEENEDNRFAVVFLFSLSLLPRPTTAFTCRCL